MSNTNNITVLDTDVSAKIDHEVEKILDSDGFNLPTAKSDLVKDYIKKIEGTYSVEGAKADTDNAVQLMCIAYNTTPVEEGGIRNDIDTIRDEMVQLQRKSQNKMHEAIAISGRIQKDITDVFKDWKPVRKNYTSEDFIGILSGDINDISIDIAKKSRSIQAQLIKIADEYDAVIKKMEVVINKAQSALAARVKDKAGIEEDIRKTEAKKAKLKSMVDGLKMDIAALEKRSAEYEKRADSAEKRAFIMSIVQVGAQMVSASIPAITAGLTGVATGGTSIIAAHAMNSTRQITNKAAADTSDDKTAKILKSKRDIADKKCEKTLAEKKVQELEKKVDNLKSKKETLANDKEENNDTKVAALDKRISATEEEITEEKGKVSSAAIALESLQGAMSKLDEGMGRMSKQQQKQATSLRDMQIKLMDKIESYQKEKRVQAGDLAEVTALLTGQRTEEETIELAIKSLGLCLEALKRSKEIIVEIAAFFHNFAAFMGNVAVDAETEVLKIARATDAKPPNTRYLKRITRNTDDFFITQAAQWHAIGDVSARFEKTFEHGRTKLNSLSGEYLHGDKLKTYLSSVSKDIDKIIAARKARANASIYELKKYRVKLDAMTEAH